MSISIYSFFGWVDCEGESEGESIPEENFFVVCCCLLMLLLFVSLLLLLFCCCWFAVVVSLATYSDSNSHCQLRRSGSGVLCLVHTTLGRDFLRQLFFSFDSSRRIFISLCCSFLSFLWPMLFCRHY